ncbi:MAG: DNA repair protein RecO, partial [Firmicutes bacterium]|nr:DNA repair protein RecO [Bacillota bacterium]
MDTIKVRGLIVKENYVGDEQKVIVILTKERGKLSVWIKDARKAKTKFITATVFSYADFVLYCGKSSYSLCEISLIENFYELTTELDKLAYASYIAEMAEKTTLEGDNCINTLFLVLKTMQAISSGVIEPRLAAVVFDIKYIQLQGYMPMTVNCTYCTKEIGEEDNIYFGGSGVVCENCLNKEA